MKRLKYIRQWLSDWNAIFINELRMIFSDSGVLIIFFLAGFVYPVLYNLIYGEGVLNGMPVAVVDRSGGTGSRRFIREMDATRELDVAYRCTDMAEAEELFRERKVNGIIMFPEDYDDRLAAMEPAVISTYADMSSFLYYKNLTMATGNVMISEMHDIQEKRFSAAGYGDRQTDQAVKPIKTEAVIPYNGTFSYTLFFIPAVLMIILQQTMFFGVSMLAGTMREQNHSFALMPDRLKGRGINRTVLGRGTAYWLIYIIMGIYTAVLIPRLFHLPQNGNPGDIFILLLAYIPACIVFSFTFSTFIRRRETAFVIFLFITPICLFLTGCSWPASNFPLFWKLFSCIFPSTFASRAFVNISSAGADLAMAGPQIRGLAAQTAVYYFLSCMAVYLENRKLKNWKLKNRKRND